METSTILFVHISRVDILFRSEVVLFQPFVSTEMNTTGRKSLHRRGSRIPCAHSYSSSGLRDLVENASRSRRGPESLLAGVCLAK